MEPIETTRGITVIHVDFDLTVPTCGHFNQLMEAACDRDARLIGLNLLQCGMVDSSGVSALLAQREAVSTRGGHVVVFGANRYIRDIFDKIRLDTFIPIVGSLSEAVDALAALERGE